MSSPIWREECAVFGIWNDPEASRIAYLGLYGQQHRGQESAGIVSINENGLLQHKGLGLVGDVFQPHHLEALIGKSAIGHTRYSTTGENLMSNAQPLLANLSNGPVAVAHNGNIVNSAKLRAELIAQGSIFQGTSDTEIILHHLARHPSKDIVTCLLDSCSKLVGAYSLVIATHEAIIAVRDPYGFRPLVLGLRPLGDGTASTVVASETCAFDLIGADLVREIEPGEILVINSSGQKSYHLPKAPKLARCVFEHVYFSRPDSKVFGRSVYESRKEMGRMLAKENGVPADIVIPVPDSGVPAAIGYAQESGLPFEFGIIRNHYIGRTFIQPSQSIRNFGVKIKLNPQRHVLEGKRVVVVDDSLVRGTTSQKIIRMIRQAGAKEVHFRIASPPITGPCYYGVDTPKKNQLIAANQSVEMIREFIGADSLLYLSHDGLLNSMKADRESYCSACFDGSYPTGLYGLDQE